MISEVHENNQVMIVGNITKQPVFNHEVFGEEFFLSEIAVERLSNYVDLIQVIISNRSLDMRENYVEREVEIKGQFQSYNQWVGNKSRLVLYVFAKEIKVINDSQQNNNTNSITLDGHICKPPIYRRTPLGREVADILVAVNRTYGRSDYIPCICWGRDARYVQTLGVGSHIKIGGRLQSREYKKWINESECVKHTAYEISVMTLKLI